MSTGYEGIYKLICVDDDKAVYAYSGENLSFPVDDKRADLLDGRIEIDLSILCDWSNLNIFENGYVKVAKDCYYAEKNTFGIDLLAIRAVDSILKRYIENDKLPKYGHWVV